MSSNHVANVFFDDAMHYLTLYHNSLLSIALRSFPLNVTMATQWRRSLRLFNAINTSILPISSTESHFLCAKYEMLTAVVKEGER